jgi:Tol biopolymer transport system component
LDPVSNCTVRRPTWIISGLTLAVLGLAIPAVRHLREMPPPPPPTLELTLGAPPGTELGSGDEPLDAAISPDERRVVFVATGAGVTMLWRRALDSGQAEALPGTEGAQLPSWSATGDAVLFFSTGRLRRLSLNDGAIADVAESPSPSGVTSIGDGSILLAPQSNGVIRRVRDGAASDATALKAGDRAHVFPLWTGVGNDFAYTAVSESGRRTVRLVHDGQERDLATTSGHGQIVNGHLLLVRDDVLLAQAIDESTGALAGSTSSLVNGVGVSTAGRSLFIASSRLLLSAGASTRARALTWFDLTGMRRGTIGEAGDFWQVRLSPDDRHVAITLVAPLLRTRDIGIVPTATGTPAQPLTFALAADSDPVWSPDGRRIAFKSLQSGRPALYSKLAFEADAKDDTIVEADATPTDWRGANIVAHVAGATSGQDVVAIDQASHAQTQIAKSGFNDTDGRWSPDGSWIAYVSDESGRPDIYANRREGQRVRVSFGGGSRPRWSRDGRSLFFLRGVTIMRAALADSSPASFTPAVTVLDAPGIRDFDVAHRRDALLALVPVASSSSATVSAMIDWRSKIPAAK